MLDLQAADPVANKENIPLFLTHEEKD